MSGASVAVDGNGVDMACDLLEMLGMNAAIFTVIAHNCALRITPE